MDGQLIVIVKVHARWVLEITIIEIQWDLQPIIWELLLMTLVIGDIYDNYLRHDPRFFRHFNLKSRHKNVIILLKCTKLIYTRKTLPPNSIG